MFFVEPLLGVPPVPQSLGMLIPSFLETPNPQGRGSELPGGIFPAPEAPAQDLILVFSVPDVEVALENNLVRHRGAPAPS